MDDFYFAAFRFDWSHLNQYSGWSCETMSRTSDHTGDSSFICCVNVMLWRCGWTSRLREGSRRRRRRSEERNRWKRKRIMLHNQAVYFPAWNGEHNKKMPGCIIVGHPLAGYVVVSGLNYVFKINSFFFKKACFSYQFPQNYLDVASSTLVQQKPSEHTAHCNIHLQWSSRRGAPHF